MKMSRVCWPSHASRKASKDSDQSGIAHSSHHAAPRSRRPTHHGPRRDPPGCRSIVEGITTTSARVLGVMPRGLRRLRVRSAPALARHANANVIAGAIISALDWLFWVCPYKRAPHEWQHHAFCTAVGKTQALHRGYCGREQGRQLRLRAGGICKR